MFRLRHLPAGLCHRKLPRSQPVEISAVYWSPFSRSGRLPRPSVRSVRGVCRQLPGRCHSTWKWGLSCESGRLHRLSDMRGGMPPWCDVWAAPFRCTRKMYTLRRMRANLPARCYYFGWRTKLIAGNLEIILVHFMAKTKLQAPPDLKIGPNNFKIQNSNDQN